MKHITIVYELPDDVGMDAIPPSKYISNGNLCDAIALKNELIDALLYVQQQVESGEEIAMSRVNEAIRKAAA